MRRVKKFKLNADNDIVLGDGTVVQTKGDIGSKGDRGTSGIDGEDTDGGSQFGPGLRGPTGLTGLPGRPGIDGEDAEENNLSSRMGAHGSLTADEHPQYQLESEKDAASGYAGLSAASRTTKGVDTVDDVIIDLATKGLVLKDVADPAHYWRITINELGAIVTADLGHTKP